MARKAGKEPGLRRQLWLLACLWGCAHAAPQGAHDAAQVALKSGHEKRSDDFLAERIDAYAQVLKGEGFTQTPFKARGFLPPSARDTHAVRVEAQHCALFVALASPTVDDLDAALYTAFGRVVVEDDGSDARPVVSLCAGNEPLELYYSVHAYQGAGAFVARIFDRPAKPGDELVALSDAGPSPLLEQTRLLRKRGFEDDSAPVDLALKDASPVRMALRVAAGECYTLVAEGRDGLEVMSMRLLDAGGRELASGVGDDGLAALQYCAAESSDYGVELLADRGHGTARVARFHGPQSVIGGARALWLGEPSPSAHAQVQAKTLDEWRASARAEHARMVLLERVTLSQGETHERALPNADAGCETWHALPEAGLTRATVRVEGLDGAKLAEAEVDGKEATFSVCQRKAARMVVTGRAGFGALTLAVTAKR